jgi:hypothetical protein
MYVLLVREPVQRSQVVKRIEAVESNDSIVQE